MVLPRIRLSMGTAMVLEKPAPFVSAFVDAVDEAIRAQSPSHGMSAIQRAWLAFCVTAVLVTNSICWARFERASLGNYSLAALSWISHSAPPRMGIYVFSKEHFAHAQQNPPVVCCCHMRGDAPHTFVPGECYGSRAPANRSVPSPTSAHRQAYADKIGLVEVINQLMPTEMDVDPG